MSLEEKITELAVAVRRNSAELARIAQSLEAQTPSTPTEPAAPKAPAKKRAAQKKPSVASVFKAESAKALTLEEVRIEAVETQKVIGQKTMIEILQKHVDSFEHPKLTRVDPADYPAFLRDIREAKEAA